MWFRLSNAIYTCGISYVGHDEAAIKAQQEQAREHAARLIAQIKAIAA